MKSKWIATGLVAFALLVGGIPGLAVADEPSVTQEVLEILRGEGRISDSDYQDLSEKARKEEASGWTIKWKNGTIIERKDKKFKIKLGGRIQLDFATINPTGSLNAAVPGGEGEGFECRRCRIYFSGDLYDRIIFKAQYDFADGEDTNFKDVYIGMKKLGPVGTVKFGHMKEPYSLEELTSSKYITFMERSLISIFDSSRNVGLLAQNHILNKRMTWALGIFAPTDNFGNFFEDDTMLNLSGRLTGLPWYSAEGDKLLHLGVSVSQQFRDSTSVTYAQRPETHLAQKYVSFASDNSVPTDGNTLLAVELAWVHGPLSIQSEYKNVWVQDPVSGDFSSFGGVYAYASYFFGRVSPIKNFDPANGGWGAWEVAGRYSYIDMKDDIYNGGKEWGVTAGVNWYLYPPLRIMANYVYAKVDDTGDLLRSDASTTNAKGHINVFELRAAIEF